MNVDPVAVRRGTKLERKRLWVLGVENQGDCGGFSLLDSNQDWERRLPCQGRVVRKNDKIKISLQKTILSLFLFAF